MTAVASRRTPSGHNTGALRRGALPAAARRGIRGVRVSAGLRAQRGGALLGIDPIQISVKRL
jgi:hypothetical protein